VGGIISTNAGGSAVIRYGNMRSLVMGLEVVLASGDVWTALNGLRKDNSGYDLKQLFIGAEGTLGLITAATLKLMPLPHTREVYWLTTDSLSSAVSTLSFLKNHVGENISAFEIMSSECLHLVGKHFPTLPIPAYQENQWAILVELEFFHHTTAHENIFMHCIDNNLISNVVVALNQQQIMQCWAVREHIPLAEKTEGFSIKHDISLPISAISEFVDRAIAQVRALIPGVITVCFGHLGDGNLHFNFTNPSTMKKETFLSLSSAINDLVYDLVYEYRGSLSAEHGIGQLKIKDLIKYKSPLEMKLMRTIKTALDPLNLMNPGKLLSQQ
jgi:FAD/FMN-containing dehydrogenase